MDDAADFDAGYNDDAESSRPAADPHDIVAAEATLNNAAKGVNVAWISFISFCMYFFITTYTVTPASLFRDSPVEMPIFKALLPLKVYFLMAPALILAFHAYLIVLTKGLAEGVAAYEDTLRRLEKSATDREVLRARLDNSVNLRALIAGHREEPSGVDHACALIAGATLNVMPVLLLLLTLLVFLPYQDEWVTWPHRIFIAADIFMCAWALWPRTPWLLRTRRFLFTSFNALVVMVVTLAAFPGEHLYTWLGWTPALELTVWAFEGPADPVDHVKRGSNRPFPNRLILPDDPKLSGSADAPAGGLSLSVRGRGFRKAVFDRSNLARVDFSATDLTEASLQGSKLEGAKFECASADDLNTDLPRSNASTTIRNTLCVGLDGANLSEAALELASFAKASLIGASLQSARGRAVDFSSALLMGADFRYAQLLAANFNEAALQGASMSEASLYGADFRNAYLQGADMNNASLQSANFQSALIYAATLRGAKLHGASFERAALTDASLACAVFFRSDFKNVSRERSYVTSNKAKECETGWYYIGDLYTYSPYSKFISEKYNLASDNTPMQQGENWNAEYFSPLDYDWGGSDGWGTTDVYQLASALQKREKLDPAKFAKFLDRLTIGLPDDAKSRVSEALAPLKPRSWSKAQDDAEKVFWKNWAEQSAEEKAQESHSKAFSERLEHIACVAEGAPHVARGLLRAGRFQQFRSEAETDNAKKARLERVNERNRAIVKRLEKASKAYDDGCRGAIGLVEADFPKAAP